MNKEQFKQALKPHMETINRASLDEVNGVTDFIVDMMYATYKLTVEKDKK